MSSSSIALHYDQLEAARHHGRPLSRSRRCGFALRGHQIRGIARIVQGHGARALGGSQILRDRVLVGAVFRE